MRYGPCAIFRGISKSCRAEIVEGLNTIMACHNFSGIQHAPNKRRRFCAHQAFVVGEVVQSFKRRNRNQFGHLPIIWPHVRSALALVKVAPDNNVIFLYFGNAPFLGPVGARWFNRLNRAFANGYATDGQRLFDAVKNSPFTANMRLLRCRGNHQRDSSHARAFSSTDVDRRNAGGG